MDRQRRRQAADRAHAQTRSSAIGSAAEASGPPLTRRRFLGAGAGAGAGAMLGLPPMLAGCFGGGSDDEPPARPTEKRTLFFNFSHEDFASTTHHLVVPGRAKVALVKVRDQPEVLARERGTNRFLREVPDDQITHHVEGVELPADAVQICYVVSGANTSSGTWNMSSMYFHIPSTAIQAAHERGAALFSANPRPRSAKRRRYGQAAATSGADMLDESVLIDTTDHASAMIGLHPDVLSADPMSAAHIHVNHIQGGASAFTAALADDISSAGPAQPQATPGQPNDVSQGWATLRPFTDQNGAPLKFTQGSNVGLIQFNPEWEPTVIGPDAAQGIAAVAQSTKNDESLGADVTGYLNGAPAGTVTPPLRGKIWHRRDGRTSIRSKPTAVAAAAADAINYTIVPTTPYDGYSCNIDVKPGSGGKPSIKLDFENTALRWLGLWLKFYDATGNPLKPSDVGIGSDVGASESLVGLLTPEFVLYGIPVQSSKFSFSFDFPTDKASSATVIASGLGSGSHTFQDTEALGIVSTTLFNLIAPLIIISVGAAEDIDAWIKLGLIPLINVSLTEFITLIEDELAGNVSYTNLLNIFVRALSRAGAAILLKIVGTILAVAVEAGLIDAVPIVGQVLQGIGIAGASLEIVETSIFVANTAWSYSYDLKLTHDLSLTITPDSGDNTTPKAANHCTVTALFDNGGTPHVQEIDLPQPLSQLQVTFPGVPLGGKVNVSASFVQVPSDPTADSVTLGKASTGLVSNDVDTLASVALQEIAFAIGPNTQYVHKQRTAFDGSAHVWQTLPAPVTKASDLRCNGVGDLCDLYAITVRQGTTAQPGYVGYAWRGNSGVPDCNGAAADVGLLATVNTGANAEQGYAAVPCGLLNKPRLAYSLLTHDLANYYLDTTHNVVRQVKLDPPAFGSSTDDAAFGAFNLDSTTLLLHPTGTLVSISSAVHKMETLKVSGTPLSVPDAKVQRLAQVHAGQGSRPGLIDTPVAAAVSADGVILVLEAANHRVQAFDTGGNPVQYFGKQKSPYWIALSATASAATTYLDLAVEHTGFVYVLSMNTSSNAYRLDIYHPTQADSNPICTTCNINAAKLAVDFWRSVYALNYEVVQVGKAEPSVSLWVPTNGAGTCS